MLRELKIENLVIIDSAELQWQDGFTAITGETGAGKSVLMNALKFILGGKVKPDIIRRGEDRLRVEAIFDMPASRDVGEILATLDVDADADEIFLQRELTAAGRNRCRVNGSVVTLADLELLGARLVDLHGQHQQQSLFDARTHLEFLDSFAKLEGERETYARLHREWKDLARRIDDRRAESRRIQEQFDFMQFQHKELDKARLSPDMEEKAEEELRVQSGLEKITGVIQGALSQLDGEEGGVPTRLSRLQRELSALDKFMTQHPFQAYGEKLEAARQTLVDLAADLRSYSLPQTADSARIDQLNARLALLQKLKGKYHTDLAGLIELRDRRERELSAFTNSQADIEVLESERREKSEHLQALAKSLSEARRRAGQAFDVEVNSRLANLGMEGSEFATVIGPAGEGETGLAPTGADRLEFFLKANAGESAKPLRQIASGGEISRIMLAIKTALAAGDPRPLLVFDELDTGIGGVTANRVGQTLRELAKHHQVFVITHLHQVAALAQHQQRVIKEMQGGRTVTRVLPLGEKERVRELARMMGDESSRATQRHAEEILAQE